MIDISLAAVPNQTLFVQLDGRAYNLTFHTTTPGVVVTVERDNEILIEGARVLPGTPVLPYRYQESGNFILLTGDEALPVFTEFGVTQFLVYLTASELTAIRA